MLYREAVEKSVSERLHHSNRGFGALLLMLCSLASMHSDDPRTLSEGTLSEHSKGWKYFRQIQLIHRGFEEPPSIYEFQLYPVSLKLTLSIANERLKRYILASCVLSSYLTRRCTILLCINGNPCGST